MEILEAAQVKVVHMPQLVLARRQPEFFDPILERREAPPQLVPCQRRTRAMAYARANAQVAGGVLAGQVDIKEYNSSG